LRLQQNFLGGETDTALTDVATTLSSPALAAMVAVTAPDTMDVVLDPDGIGGAPEIVTVTAHTAAATTATITRGSESSVARAHASSTDWVHGSTAGWATKVQDDIASQAAATDWTLVTSFVGNESSMTGWTAVAGTWVNRTTEGYWESGTPANSRLRLDTVLFPYQQLLVNVEMSTPTDGTGSNRFGVILHDTLDSTVDYVPGAGRYSNGATQQYWGGVMGRGYYDTTPATAVSPAAGTTWTEHTMLFTPNTVQTGMNGEWKSGAYAGADFRQVYPAISLWTAAGAVRFRNFSIYKRMTPLPAGVI